MTKKKEILESDALIQYSNRLFFAQTLAHGQKTGEITPERLDEIHKDTAVLSHKLIAIRADDFTSSGAIRKHIQEAFELTSIGLEYGGKGDLDKSVHLLNKNRTIKFFQIGNTLVDKLAARSQNTLEASKLSAPEERMLPATVPDEIQVYNDWEREFLESIFARNLVIDAAQVVLHQVSKPRPLTSLGDIAIANRQLDNLDFRLSYFRALPQEKVFAPDNLFPISSDLPQQITKSLMVNLILYREVDFHLTPEDWANFHDIAYDTENDAIKKDTRDRLLGWIGQYLNRIGQAEEVRKYAVKYWRHCLKQVEKELKSEPSDLAATKMND